MSLTAFTRHKTPVRLRMAKDFPKPKLRLEAELRLSSTAPNRALIAFDYLLRFHLQREHPFAALRPWVAERDHELISDHGEDGILLESDKGLFIERRGPRQDASGDLHCATSRQRIRGGRQPFACADLKS